MDEIELRCYESHVYLRAGKLTFTELAGRREARRLSRTTMEIWPNMMIHLWFLTLETVYNIESNTVLTIPMICQYWILSSPSA